MNIIDRFQTLMDAKRFREALPLIEEIVRRDEFCETSWYNYAVCLEGLARYDDAIAAFRRGYELDPSDKGFQFRIFRALALKGDVKEFTKFAEAELTETPEVLGLLEESPEFAGMVRHKWFQFRMKQFRA
jgi:tetratricopeptide (TPR) repeat protein